MALEWQVLIVGIAALLLRLIANGDRAKAAEVDDRPLVVGQSAEGGPRTTDQVLGEKSRG